MKTLEELKKTRNLLIAKVGEDGGYGNVEFGKLRGTVIWSYGGGWEHVSVSPYKHNYTPSWEEMCRIKDMFWHDDEVVVQYHPAKSEYVNNMPNCLHLWRPIGVEMPVPPAIMVGVKDGQSKKSIHDDIREVMKDA